MDAGKSGAGERGPRVKPIIFSAPMVRALLAGTKTQTRRILKPQPEHKQVHTHKRRTIYDGEHRMWCWRNLVLENIWDCSNGDDRKTLADAQPWQVGDRLWVREKHQVNAFGCHPNWKAKHIIYAADDACVELLSPVFYVGKCDIGLRGWHSPIHMPRWASRLTLTVTDVRVQRLQDISEKDAEAEGCEYQIWDQALAVRNYSRPDGWFCMWGGHDNYTRPDVYVDEEEIWRASYQTLWNSIHGPGAWDENPWVCALTFRTDRRNIDASELATAGDAPWPALS